MENQWRNIRIPSPINSFMIMSTYIFITLLAPHFPLPPFPPFPPLPPGKLSLSHTTHLYSHTHLFSSFPCPYINIVLISLLPYLSLILLPGSWLLSHQYIWKLVSQILLESAVDHEGSTRVRQDAQQGRGEPTVQFANPSFMSHTRDEAVQQPSVLLLVPSLHIK